MNATSSPNLGRGGFFQRWISAHPSIQSPSERRSAELTAALSLLFAIVTFFAATTSAPVYGLFNTLNLTTLIFSAASVAAYLFSRGHAPRRALVPFIGGFTLMSYVAATFAYQSVLFIVMPFAVLFLMANLLQFKWMLIFIAANFIASVALTIALTDIPTNELAIVIASLFVTGMFVVLFAWHRDSLERLRLEEVERAGAELQRSNADLLRAQGEAAERLSELQIAAQVGHSISQVRALDVMLTEAAELIRKQFDLYYVQAYLVNPARTQLVLQAGTGSVGAELIGRGHSLPLDSASVNGRAAAGKKSVVIADTSVSASFRPNPLLPATRSEIAVPLMLGENVIGVLDMQSERADALNEDALPAFEALAGQLAVAIQNASLLAESQQARAEVEKQTARLTRENWREYLDAIHKPETIGFQFEKNQIVPLGEAQIEAAKENALAAPISVAGEALGSLVVELESEDRNPQNTELVNAVARQVAQQIESLRLLESAERYRLEAEEASRRLTLEGWKSYMEGVGKAPKYFYDMNEVRPLNDNEALPPATSLPLKARDATVGRLAVQGLDANDRDAFELANAVAERLSAHIENLRQADATQSALAQSEKLFEASREITRAADLQELTAAAIEAIDIPVINRAILTSMNYDADGNVESMDVLANWWNGSGSQATPIGTHYPLEVVRMMKMFVSPTPLFFDDGFTDERVDPVTLQLVHRLNLRAVGILPLHAGAEQIGLLLAEGEEPHHFTEEEKKTPVHRARAAGRHRHGKPPPV